MRSKQTSDHECNICGLTKDSDDDSDDECWMCCAVTKAIKNGSSLSDMRKEIKQLKDELKTAKAEIQRLSNTIGTAGLKMSNINDQLKFIKIDSENTTTVLESIVTDVEAIKEDVESIKEDGIPLNKSNIRFIKKTARKIAIREIVEWESD